MVFEGYQLREAAGMHWLLDMKQKGLNYKRPLCLNESGAYFFKLFQQGKSKEQIIEHLCDEFGVREETATEDVDIFLEQLEKYNIVI